MPFLEAHQTYYLRNSLADISCRSVNASEHERNIVINIHIADKLVILKHEADGLPELGDFSLLHFHQVETVYTHHRHQICTLVSLYISDKQLDKGTFSCAVFPTKKTNSPSFILRDTSLRAETPLSYVTDTFLSSTNVLFTA